MLLLLLCWLVAHLLLLPLPLPLLLLLLGRLQESSSREPRATSRGGLHVTCVCARNLFSKLRIGVNGAVPMRFGLETSRKQGKNASHNTVCAHVFLSMSLSCHVHFSSVPSVL